jgi:hypothetical protein
MPSVKEMLEAAARRRGVKPEALQGFIAGITLMSFGPNITEEQFQECLDLLVLDPNQIPDTLGGPTVTDGGE